MRFNDRAMALAGIPDLPVDAFKKEGGKIKLHGGGGGGPNYTYSQTSNIPEYAQPYVERMMGATEKQIFNFDDQGNATGFQPYKSFRTAMEDKYGAGAGETVAGFTPMQQGAMNNLQNYRIPGQTGIATDYTNQAIMGTMRAGRYDPTEFSSQYNAPGQYSMSDLQQYQMERPENVSTGRFIDPDVMQQYMSPYQQGVTDIGKREAMRQSNIMQQQSQAQASQQGAFGGSRAAMVESERQRNLGQQMEDIQTRGSQAAFEQAAQQFQTDQQRALQASLANQQMGFGTGQQNLAARLGVQQLGEQARQFGYGQQMTAAETAARYGLEAQRASEQSRQYGSELGLRSYDQAMRGAQQLGQLGSQQYQQEMGLMGQQMDVGAKQQAFEQARLNQIIQDYATEQQYPFIQLGTLSNMLRGLPMQASSTQMYQAQPSMFQQGIGFMGAGANMYNAMNYGRAEGGHIKEMASGGIASGVHPNKLPSMMKRLSDDQLEQKMSEQDADPGTLGIAQAEKQRRDKVRGMASGGVVAFKAGEDVKDKEKNKKVDQVTNPMVDVKNAADSKGIMTGKSQPAPAPATRPKAAAPKPAAETSPYQADFKRMEAAQDLGLSQLVGLTREAREEAKRTPEDRIREKRDLYKKFDIDERAMYENEKAEQKRALVQAEGDAKKAEYLRWAQMFAQFGSTPGPILKAAVMAINDNIPQMLDDRDKARAVQRDIKKAIYELDKADLMAQKGDVDKALEMEKEAKGKLAALSLDVAKAHSKDFETRFKGKQDMAKTELTGQYDVEERRVTAAARGATGDGAGKQQRHEDKREDAQTRQASEELRNWRKDNGVDKKRGMAQAVINSPTSKPDVVATQKKVLADLDAQEKAKMAEIKKNYPEARLGGASAAPAPTIQWSDIK
jgi:hypothetical protein